MRAGSTPFVTDDDKMLWLGLLERDTGIPASKHLQIKDEVVALDFNLAVTLRLLRFDNERETTNQKNLARRIARATWGGEEEADDDVIYDDKYSDANTEVW